MLCGISIPSTICTSPYLYRARNLVQRFFNKIEHCRRVATRYDKLAANYLAFFQLASIRLWLRVKCVHVLVTFPCSSLDNRAAASHIGAYTLIK